MKLMSVTTEPIRKELRACDFYPLNGGPVPDFCKGKYPWEVVAVQIFGYNVNARFQCQHGEPMPDTVESPKGTLRCMSCDEYGVVTATGFLPGKAEA